MPLPPVAFEHAQIAVPERWTQAKRDADVAIFRSPDGREEAMITVMRFGADPSFDDFKRLCSHRYDAERKVLTNGFIDPDGPQPFEADGHFGMFYSGLDRDKGRAFSGYLTLVDRQLITIYVESVGIAFEDHAKTFKEWVLGFHRK